MPESKPRFNRGKTISGPGFGCVVLVLLNVCGFVGLEGTARGLVVILNMVSLILFSIWVLNTLCILQDQEKMEASRRLPTSLLNSVAHKNRLKSGFWVFKGIDNISNFLIINFCLYLLWIVLSLFFPLYPSQYVMWQIEVQTVLSTISPAVVLRDEAIRYSAFFTHIGYVLSVAGLFWLTRLVMRITERKVLWAGLLSLIYAVMALYYFSQHLHGPGEIFVPVDWIGAGSGFTKPAQALGLISSHLSPYQARVLETGYAAHIFLQVIILLIGFELSRHLRKKRARSAAAIIGFIVMMSLILFDYMALNTSGIWALWVSGWSCLAAWMSLAMPDEDKNYSLRQS